MICKTAKQAFYRLSIVFIISGCSTATTQIVPTKYDENTSARLRVYGHNGIKMNVYKDVDGCPTSADSESALHISGSLRQSFKSLFSTQDNTSIGMPLADIDHSKNDFFVGQEFYTEIVIPSKKPVTIFTAFNGTQSAGTLESGSFTIVRYCRPMAVTFYPKEGQDYESYLYVNLKEEYCEIKLVRLDSKGKEIDDVNKTVRKGCGTPRAEWDSVKNFL